MKKYICLSLLLAFILALPLSMSGAKEGKAAIKFDTYRADLGTITENGGPKSVEFTFENTGDANLIIIEAKATCGCTRPEYPKSPIAPGKKGKIKVTYNPQGRPGPIDRTVTVTTNGKPKKVRLHLGGTVATKK